MSASRILIDTQAFIWMMNASNRLSVAALHSITLPNVQLCVSIATPWEMAIKVSIGKLRLGKPIQEIVEKYGTLLHFLPIQAHHLAIVETLPLHHRDPFDRIIIAQAIAENIPVVSSDAAFDDYSVQRIWE